MSEKTAKMIFRDMLKAVNHCHRNKIIHRDIIMENFLINKDEESGRAYVKLTDFGSAVMTNDLNQAK